MLVSLRTNFRSYKRRFIHPKAPKKSKILGGMGMIIFGISPLLSTAIFILYAVDREVIVALVWLMITALSIMTNIVCTKFGRLLLSLEGTLNSPALSNWAMRFGWSLNNSVKGAECPQCGYTDDLDDVLIHLNDRHRWRFRSIARWLEDSGYNVEIGGRDGYQ